MFIKNTIPSIELCAGAGGQALCASKSTHQSKTRNLFRCEDIEKNLLLSAMC